MALPSWSQTTTTYTYDTRGRVKSIVRAANTVSYTYDAAANRIALTVSYPAAPSVSNTSLSSTYNGSGSVALPVSGVYSSIGFPGGSSAHGTLGLTGSTVTYYPTAG